VTAAVAVEAEEGADADAEVDALQETSEVCNRADGVCGTQS
jgi:hypothetical protein